ncbi:MAG: hypothetical protein AAF790_00140 [Planctomycetota bacterium]
MAATQPTAGGQGAAAAQPNARGPIAAIANEFLSAVVAGDTARATGCLTPAAIARFEASSQGFASPEIGAPDFRIGEVRDLGQGRAAVQCLLSDSAGDAEMLCLVKQVGSAWKVSGVAYEVAPGQPPVILNFEEYEQPPAPGYFVGQPPATPPQTAAQPAAGQPLR